MEPPDLSTAFTPVTLQWWWSYEKCNTKPDTDRSKSNLHLLKGVSCSTETELLTIFSVPSLHHACWSFYLLIFATQLVFSMFADKSASSRQTTGNCGNLATTRLGIHVFSLATTGYLHPIWQTILKQRAHDILWQTSIQRFYMRVVNLPWMFFCPFTFLIQPLGLNCAFLWQI